MPNSSRMVAFVIAVADAKPLKYLAASLNGARDFAQWAQAQAYETTTVTDDDEPVTIERLKKELDRILATAAALPIERFVLYFAGHGLIQEAGEGLWLVSDWSAAARCVNVALLKRRLFTYAIEQVAIFSDACRLLPTNYKTAELTLDSVIGWGPRQRGPGDRTPPVDSFIAAQDYAAAFAVPGKTPEDDRCIFTGVLMPGLWGVKPAAFSKIQKDRVVSRSLGLYLEQAVRDVAEKYKLQLAPTISPLFPEQQDVYFLAGLGAAAPPDFPDWPPPDQLLIDPGTRSADVTRPDAAAKGRDLLVPSAIPGGGVGSSAGMLKLPGKRPVTPESLALKLQQPFLAGFDAACGFALSEAVVVNVWAPPHVRVQKTKQEGWVTVHSGNSDALLEPAAPVLLELEDDIVAAVAALPNFVASVICNSRGVSAIVYRNRYMPETSVAAAAKALTRMARGGLRPSDAIDLAVDLREFKHADPVLGVISAYLYDSIGDLDSIRRMAYAYVDHGQAIPYDIALLAQLQGITRNGMLWVDVPAVAKRPPRTAAEETHRWTFDATPRVNGPVGGLWPWMRQGWPFLDDPSDLGSTLIHDGLHDMTSHLLPGRFATLDRTGAKKLAAMFGLVDRPF